VDEGHDHGGESHPVNLIGWREGALAITGMKILLAHTEMSLTQAKSAIERCLSGERREFVLTSSGEAREFAGAMDQAGFITEFTHTDQGMRIGEGK
jgi:hypothetical protein